MYANNDRDFSQLKVIGGYTKLAQDITSLIVERPRPETSGGGVWYWVYVVKDGHHEPGGCLTDVFMERFFQAEEGSEFRGWKNWKFRKLTSKEVATLVNRGIYKEAFITKRFI